MSKIGGHFLYSLILTSLFQILSFLKALKSTTFWALCFSTNIADRDKLLLFLFVPYIWLNKEFLPIITTALTISLLLPQVLQESLVVPGTDVHLVYHSSESSGYMSLILIQMTPATIPSTLSRVHLKVSVEGVTLTKMFEADANLKYTFAWDRENAYKQPVYGIVTARGKKIKLFVCFNQENCSFTVNMTKEYKNEPKVFEIYWKN